MVWTHFGLLAVAGALGTLARAGCYAAVRSVGWNSIWATLLVNVAGSFLFGLIWPLAEQGRLRAETRLVILSGFMGAFTTFSTFAFETGQFIRSSPPQWGWAWMNIVASNVLGIAALLLGLRLAGRVV